MKYFIFVSLLTMSISSFAESKVDKLNFVSASLTNDFLPLLNYEWSTVFGHYTGMRLEVAYGRELMPDMAVVLSLTMDESYYYMGVLGFEYDMFKRNRMSIGAGLGMLLDYASRLDNTGDMNYEKTLKVGLKSQVYLKFNLFKHLEGVLASGLNFRPSYPSTIDDPTQGTGTPPTPSASTSPVEETQNEKKTYYPISLKRSLIHHVSLGLRWSF